jgi:hypothetical protein
MCSVFIGSKEFNGRRIRVAFYRGMNKLLGGNGWVPNSSRPQATQLSSELNSIQLTTLHGQSIENGGHQFHFPFSGKNQFSDRKIKRESSFDPSENQKMAPFFSDCHMPQCLCSMVVTCRSPQTVLDKKNT